MTITSRPFERFVSLLKERKKTCVVVEQCCGGLIQASILAQPGASSVYFGGSVSYNTRKAKPLLLNSDELHQSLIQKQFTDSAAGCIQSKLHWTAETSIAYCQAMGTDFAIAEGGASGPTFRPSDMKTGFAVISVAGKGEDGTVSLLGQDIVHSPTNNREENMRLFANAAASFAIHTICKGKDPCLHHDNLTVKTAESLVLDRATHFRTDEAKLQEMEKVAQYIILQDCRSILIRSNTPSTKLAFLTHEEAIGIIENQRKTFLGIRANDTPVFAVDILDEKFCAPRGTEIVDTRTTAPLLDKIENELALHATAYASWQRRNKYCSLCGGATIVIDGGTCLQCSKCAAKSWPRQDPSMICAVSSRDGEKILLARSPRHPEKLHTTLAGFVEAGETLEAAVAREAFEETGIRIDEGSVQYVGTQPWPFPQSCMFGFLATADEEQPLHIDAKEILSARWFTKEEVAKAATVEGPTMQKGVALAALEHDPMLPLLIPPRGVIARKLIDQWLTGSWKYLRSN
ncbi:NAD+ diphosphatase [Fistulifera solaris]|uniref:NAD(+) diphosphatase n=1 Tax=Fistulifera solaris TaxID=1519565 RepID=A0A1Z5J7P6_FISSO|nr:NAD+ diphosphatase [Fistulifera solaris]|eukprot:GAX09838.1 NAD+ diphosphatase [Fistulifera solaris]